LAVILAVEVVAVAEVVVAVVVAAVAGVVVIATWSTVVSPASKKGFGGRRGRGRDAEGGRETSAGGEETDGGGERRGERRISAVVEISLRVDTTVNSVNTWSAIK
jgi:hypothetical protein